MRFFAGFAACRKRCGKPTPEGSPHNRTPLGRGNAVNPESLIPWAFWEGRNEVYHTPAVNLLEGVA